LARNVILAYHYSLHRALTRMLASIALLGVALTCAAARGDAFVRVARGRFVVDGAPFVFAGANVDALHGELERRTVGQTLDAVKADGMSVVRVWALGEGPSDAPPWHREHVLFRVGETGFLEGAFVALDRVVEAARARGLRVLITLCNGWPDFGGVPQYLRWAGLPTRGYGARDRFYADPRVRKLFLAHVERVVGRTNSLTGQRYADDPTIFGWELMNESEVDDEAGAQARLRFIDEIARRVHALAPHHLVSSGVSEYRVRDERSAWRAACALSSIDFCDAHLYPQAGDLVDSAEALFARVDDRVQLARWVLHKPIVFGEFGFDTRADHDGWLDQPRARWFARFLDRLALDRVDGAFVWIYEPWHGRPRDFGIYVDRPDTDDVRAELRAFAAAIPVRHGENPRLGAAFGDALRYPAYQVIRRSGAPQTDHRQDVTTVSLAVDEIDVATWERTGTWDGGPFVHAYGFGDGSYAWRFPAPDRPAKRVVVRARISSEYPGTDAPPHGTSRVLVTIDGRTVGTMTAPPDDGRGAVVELASRDRRLLDALRGGAHELRFAVTGPGAHGLCIYGRRTEHGSDETQPIDVELRFER
jgi:mannan endo-1,4-beta-mannosidase